MSYIDSRGVPMDDMSFSQALERVHALAATNLPDEHDIARDENLIAECAWQTEALDTIEDTITNFHEEIDDTFSPPGEYGDWPVEATQVDRSADASSPANALCIALEMARNALPDASTVRGIAEADEYDRDNQAIELTEDFIVLHGAELDAKIHVIRMPTTQ